MTYQLTRHIEVREDSHGGEKILAMNLFRGTRLLCGPELWELLERYREPAEPEENDPFFQRAVQAGILEEVGSTPTPPLVDRFKEVSAKVLKYRKTQASDDLCERLGQLSEVCNPVSTASPIDYFIWHDPKLVFRVMLDHFKIYLETELGVGNTSGLAPGFLASTVGRPPRVSSLEQQVCTSETAWKRASMVAEKMGPKVDILVIGDDDLVSLALPHFVSNPVQVLELDPKLVRFLRKKSEPQVKIKRRDLADGLPSEYQQQYDVVLSDPMYSQEGMAMFLDCCRAALKPNSESRFFLSTYPPLLEEPEQFFELLEEKGFEVKSSLENFNRYPFPENMRAGANRGLEALGYHPKLSHTLLSVPYLYAHLYECALRG